MKTMGRASRLVGGLVGLTLLGMAGSANATIILTLEGTPGSSEFTLSASGSFTTSNQEAAANNDGDFFRIIRTDVGPTGWWTPQGPEWSGDIFGVNPALTVTPGTGGSLTFEVTGDVMSTHTFDDLFLGNEVWVPFDDSNNLDWPVILPPDQITILASGFITFTSDITYDDLNPGIYTFQAPMQDGLQFIVQQAPVDVPEPSTLALFVIALGGLGFMMRRRVV